MAVIKGKLHSRFTSHGVADDVGFVDPVLLHKSSQISSQNRIVKVGCKGDLP